MKQKLFLVLMLFVLISSSVTAQTTDPWITEIYYNEWFRKPDDVERIPKMYNGGQWNSKEELRKYIMEFQKSRAASNIWFQVIKLKDPAKSIIIANDNNGPGAAALISNASGSIIASDGASIVSGGAGNLIGQDGAGLREKVMDLGGMRFGSSYNVQSTESTKPIKSGKGALIITLKKK